MMSSEMEERCLTISGVKVVFPCKPYPSQFSMMDRVIKGLERRQNSLLESPTGSGKSLALLCSALAWQNAQHEKLVREGALDADQGDTCKPCECTCNRSPTVNTEYSPESKPNKDSSVINISDEEDEDDDFKSSAKFRTPKLGSKKREHVKIGYETNSPTKQEHVCTCKAGASSSGKTPKVPTIYFGTRTHKQIAQITRELGKTAYHDVRMAILASREYTCVHPEVTRMKNKSEGCRDRLDNNGPGCKFNDRAKRTYLSQAQLQKDLSTAWDLEDFIGSCKTKKACPYFVTRNIKVNADIVFCPYNYLIDPLVRKSMDITLKDQVVILDEAHNIEDCARDAASGSLTTDQITLALQNIQEMLDFNVKFSDHLKMKRMLDSLLQFIEENSSNLDQADYDTSYKVWSGFDIVARLKSIGLGPESFTEYQASLENVGTNDEDQTVRNRRNQEVKLKSATLITLELVVQILDYMYRDDLKYVEDFRVAIMKSMQFVPHKNTNDSWMGKNRRGGSKVEVFTVNFWCMNPAVAFSDFNACRNVVLSSGTLSPMATFSSELGIDFPIQLEANHVIQDKQVMVGALGTGPGGSQLQAVYRTMETFTFQDELGNLLLQVCRTVPHGVLCFLPSYRGLEKFTERWKLTGLWSKLARRKRVLVEPRRGDREDFDDMMKAFYEVVKGETRSEYLNEESHYEDDSDIDGALFLAVCRGKVSEGMDFADNNARAVITVGIPFPSIKDLQVKLKREYNDRHKNERGLLSGNDWYEIQAFRALNQALGRCIRHRKDWGALIIVDDRFVKKSNKYCKGLSKWVRNKVQTFDTFSQFLETLSEFTETMSKEMPVVSPNTSFIPCTPQTGRRESIYKRDQMDTSLVLTPRPSPDLGSSSGASPAFRGTGIVQSPYFSPKTPPYDHLARTLLQSPPISNLKPPAGTASVPSKGDNAILTYQVTGEVSSLPLEQQLKNIISSGVVPKDKPYFVVLNKGRPDEQTFLIEPNKKGSSKRKDNLKSGISQPAPTTSSVPGINHSAVNDQALRSLLLANPLRSPPGTNTMIPAPLLNPNSTTSLPTVPLPQLKTFMAAGGSNLSIQEQLNQVINSPVVPKNEAYYVLVNEGRTDKQTFLIQPSTGTTTTENVNDAGSNNNNLGVNNPGVVAPSPVQAGNPANKFLKFCQLPTTPLVPMATPITPNKNGQQTSGTSTSMLTNSTVANAALTNKNQYTNGCKKETLNAPVVTEDEVKLETQTLTASGSKRKPLFKKKDTKAADDTAELCEGEQTIQRQNGTDAGVKSKNEDVTEKQDVVKSEVVEDKDMFKSQTVGNKNNDMAQNEKNQIKAESEEIKPEIADEQVGITGKSGRRTSSVRGRLNPSLATTLKHINKTDHDTCNGSSKLELVTNDKILTEIKAEPSCNEETEGKQMMTFVNSEEDDFLVTRRKSGRKRKVSSRLSGAKRIKGIQYDGEDEKDMKENMKAKKTVQCARCGTVLTKHTDFERQKHHLPFLDHLCSKTTELLFFSQPEVLGSSLVPLTVDIGVPGVHLNSFYDEKTSSSVQYLQCNGCVGQGTKTKDSPHILGARVILAQEGATVQQGQTWILSSAVST